MKNTIKVFIICFIIGICIGIYYYRISLSSEKDIIHKVAVEDECTIIAENNQNKSTNTIIVSNNEEKIGISTKIIKKVYYKNCNHVVEETDKATQEMINLTEDEFKDKYKKWEIQRFTSKEAVLYKEEEDFCNEHYILKEENGYITIYKVDMQGNEILYNTTDIWTGYLSQEDLENIKNGLKVYTTKELNKLIEDFE